MENNSVSLQISKDIVNPIVQAKVKEAVLAALGGTDELVKKVCDQIINQKVNDKGAVSSYSSDNKYNWIDIIVTEQLKAAVKDELQKQIIESTAQIKEAMISQIRTKKGASLVAKALLDGLNGSFASNWKSSINVSLSPIKD